jgi:uncharacterized iron-regulated membrane protein
MQYRIPHHAPRHWFVRLLGGIVGVVVLVGLFFLGLTIFIAAAGLAILAFVVIAIRIWWLRRQLRVRAARAARHDSAGVTLEGEYEERRRD